MAAVWLGRCFHKDLVQYEARTLPQVTATHVTTFQRRCALDIWEWWSAEALHFVACARTSQPSAWPISPMLRAHYVTAAAVAPAAPGLKHLHHSLSSSLWGLINWIYCPPEKRWHSFLCMRLMFHRNPNINVHKNLCLQIFTFGNVKPYTYRSLSNC